MGSQLLQNTEINIVLHWKFWRKYGPVWHLFSCTVIRRCTRKPGGNQILILTFGNLWLQIQKDIAPNVQYFQPRYNMCSAVSTLVWLVVGRKARQPTISLWYCLIHTRTCLVERSYILFSFVTCFSFIANFLRICIYHKVENKQIAL